MRLDHKNKDIEISIIMDYTHRYFTTQNKNMLYSLLFATVLNNSYHWLQNTEMKDSILHCVGYSCKLCPKIICIFWNNYTKVYYQCLYRDKTSELCLHFWLGCTPVLLDCPQVTSFLPSLPIPWMTSRFVYTRNY